MSLAVPDIVEQDSTSGRVENNGILSLLVVKCQTNGGDSEGDPALELEGALLESSLLISELGACAHKALVMGY